MTETSKLNFVVICCASVFLSFTAFAEDLTVARGESVMLSSSHVYDTVNVSGSLTIPDGLTLQATTLNLGPNADDQAVVTVLGREDNSLKAAQVNIGGPNGGSGKIVSLARAASYESPVLSIPKVTIHANATAGEHGTIDILELGPQNVRKIVSWTNHSTVPARVRVKDGRLGYDQNFSGTYFTGPFLIEGYMENSDIIIANSWTGNWALNNGDLTISTHGTVTIDYGGNQASWNMSVNRSVVWQNIRELILKTKATYQTQDNDLLPYGKNVGPVRIDSQNACIDLKFYSSHINSLIAAKRAAGATPAVKGTKLANLIFGYDNLDGVFSGDVAPEVTVQKIGTGTLHVNGASSCGTLKLTEGTLKVTSQLDVENLIVEEGATLIVDKVHLAPSKSSCIRGSVILQNGGRCTEESVVSSDDFSRIEGISSKGRLIKDGSGTCLLAGSQSVAEEIHVKNGTLDFCAGGYHAKLFKFNFTNWTKVGYTENWREGEFLLDEIALIDASWHRIGYLMRADPVGTSPATLRPGYAAFAENTFCEVPVNQLFDATDIPRVRVTSPLTTDPGGVTIYVRLADGDPPPVAWNFATGFGGMPRAWTVSASLDNGATWEVLESQSDFTASDPLAMRWFDGAEMKLNCETIPPRFPFHSTSSLFAAPGAPNMPRAVNLRVDEGATIDFSKVEGAQQKVNALTINVDDNGGTIKNAAFEEDGVINLVSDTGHFATGDCAFQFVNCTGMNHFQSWRVTCDGVDISDGVVTYHEQTQTFHYEFQTMTISESGEGEALSETTGILVLNIDEGVTYTNTTALTGSGMIRKTGSGTLVLAASSPSFTGKLFVMSGKVIAPATNAFGSKVVYVKGSTTEECQIVLGSETQDVVYDNDFVFLESSSATCPALIFVTQGLKATTINGKIIASGTLEMRDSSTDASSQSESLVTFNGEICAEGQEVSYPTDNATVWNGRITAQLFRANSRWPCAGSHSINCSSNQLGKVEFGYNIFSLSSNALNGAALRLVGNNNEEECGFLRIQGDQTMGWIEQEHLISGTSKRYYARSASTLTLIGGTSYASCQLHLLDPNKPNEKTSFVLDSQNDDFVQVFSNSVWTASGDLVIRQGTLRFAGETSAQNISTITIEGGAFELESTLDNPMSKVKNIVMGPNTRLRVASANAFNKNVQLTLGEGATLELADGIQLEIKRGTYNGRGIPVGTFTGDEGFYMETLPWIVGSGILRVKTGNGFVITVL